MFKKISIFAIASLVFNYSFAANEMSPKWISKTNVANPESAYFEPNTGFIFISNISGDGVAKDGKGWITKISAAGVILKKDWVSGLNAPKGMRAYKQTLWVTDIDTLVSIDIDTGKVLKKISRPGAKFLNDIAISSTGEIYVTDTIDRKILILNKDKLEVFLEGDESESPNGLLIVGDKLIVSAWGLAAPDWSAPVPGRLYSLNLKTKAKTLITKEPLGNLDGLEMRSNGNFLVSDWSKGQVFQINPDGKTEMILDIREKGAADIGYIPSTDTLLVPGMVGNHVTAYDLSKLK